MKGWRRISAASSRWTIPDFEILLAVRRRDDPAVAIAESLRRAYPQVPAQLLVVGEPPYANAKVFSLDRMMAAARNDVLVMSDSDIRVSPDMLRVVAAEFQDPKLGVATCPYRAVAGRSFWSQLEAVGMNTEFLGGVLVARMLEGMKFAVGPTIVARKQALQEIGGFDRLKDYLAEDFVMGKFAADAGWTVSLSSYVVEHRIGSETAAVNAAHRLRWARSTRRSRPAGYVGQLFTNPLPLGCAACAGAAGVVAGSGRYRGNSRSRRVCDSGLGPARSRLCATLVVDPGAGFAKLRFLDRGVFRQHDYLEREEVLPAGGRTICVGGLGFINPAPAPPSTHSLPPSRTASGNYAPHSRHPTDPYSAMTKPAPTPQP